MNNQQVLVPFHGFGEIYLDLSHMYWYLYKWSYYNLKKEIPFFKYFDMRCYIRLNVQPTDI